MKLILASGSFRRKLLLSWLDIPFGVVESEFDESSILESDAKKLVERLAIEKAKTVADKVGHRSGVLVIGADSVVEVEGEIVGKPKDEKDATRILNKLSANKHLVYTGVAVFDAFSGKTIKNVERSEVTFRKLSSKEIEEYVGTGEPMDKAGAYAIQMGAAGFIKRVEGSYTNVVGLPLLTLQKLLERQGYKIKKDVSKIIFKETGYRS